MLLEQAKTGNDCFFMLGTYQYVCTMYVSLLAGGGKVRLGFYFFFLQRREELTYYRGNGEGVGGVLFFFSLVFLYLLYLK